MKVGIKSVERWGGYAEGAAGWLVRVHEKLLRLDPPPRPSATPPGQALLSKLGRSDLLEEEKYLGFCSILRLFKNDTSFCCPN